MVFFANAYINARRKEQREREDRRQASLLMYADTNLSYESAMQKVKEFRMREESGIVDTVQKAS